MLTIAEASGLIAAAVMFVQYWLPVALVIILVKLAGNENTAATWSAINRTISTTLWPFLLRADSVGHAHRARSALAVSWTMTLGAALLVLAGVMAPLGLRDEIVPGSPQAVEFEYVRDQTSWGKVTPVRPDRRFGRYCEFGRRLNCPGQYQGIDFVEMPPGSGNLTSVKKDPSSTINTTLPANYTAMFSSATADVGNTVSGMFDVQYRRWKAQYNDIIDHGEVQIQGDYRYIELLIPQEKILLREGLIIDLKDNPGIGFRNHTVPIGLAHGGTWQEDLTWLEPVTSCVDTNLTLEVKIADTMDSFLDNTTITLVDRGAFRGLDLSALETRPWGDNQSLDLYGRAHKAARMFNVLTAKFLNVSLPLDPAVETIPSISVANDTFDRNLRKYNEIIFNSLARDQIIMDQIVSLGKAEFLLSNSTNSTSDIPPPADFVPRYPDGWRKLWASNYTAINNICKGYYLVDSTSIDRRAANISNPMVECGLLVGAGRDPESRYEDGSSTPLDDILKGREKKHKNLYICATGIRASIKTVDFRYNDSDGDLANLQIDAISDKVYPDERSKPLWAVETSGRERMTFDPLWGIVNDSFETTEGFYTMRAEKLWLPTVVSSTTSFGTRQAFDSLAAVAAPGLNVANLYTSLSDHDQYSGQLSYPLVERFGRLSANETTASRIPSLILTDVLASLLVGTKTAIHTAPVEIPARLAVEDVPRRLPRFQVVAYRRAIGYDLRFAIPSFVLLALLLLVTVWAAVVLLMDRDAIRNLRDMYNQTSAGRLATGLLRPADNDPTVSSGEWVDGDGRLVLSFGRIGDRKEGYFVRLEGDDGGYSKLPTYSEPKEEIAPSYSDTKAVMTADSTEVASTEGPVWPGR